MPLCLSAPLTRLLSVLFSVRFALSALPQTLRGIRTILWPALARFFHACASALRACRADMQRSPWSAAEEAAALRQKLERHRSVKSSAGGNGRGHSDDDDDDVEDDESGDDGLDEADGEQSNGDSGEARYSWREFAAVVNSAHHVATTLHEWNQVW
jgi:hypothetical protein